jgi:hypothetical protein
MKVNRFQLLLAAAALGSVTTLSHAAVVGNLTATIDWDTLTTSGVTMTPTSITFEGNTFSSSEEVYLDYGIPLTEDEASSVDGANVQVSYSSPDGSLNLLGNYGSTSNESKGQGGVNNSSHADESGFAGANRIQFFTASSDGAVTFSVDYRVDGSMSIDQTSHLEDSEFGGAGYEFLWEAFDATAFLAGAPNPLEVNDKFEAEALRMYLGCEQSQDFGCLPSADESGELTLSLDVMSGRTYAFGAEGNVWIGSQVNAVPLPAAAWFFGSALLGLIGIARRKTR